jgi:two-component system CheB/CheR fusion protein
MDLDFGLPLADVKPLLQESLRDPRTSREATVPAINRRGRQIICKLTTTPLAGADHEASQGVILLMEEVQPQ